MYHGPYFGTIGVRSHLKMYFSTASVPYTGDTMAPTTYDEVVTLKVKKRTLERLNRAARRNETPDELINRLIDEHEKHTEEERERIQETWEDIHE